MTMPQSEHIAVITINQDGTATIFLAPTQREMIIVSLKRALEWLQSHEDLGMVTIA